MKVYWGDISLVKVEYLLFETALKTDLMPIITYCQEQTFLSKAKTTFMNSFIKIQERSSSASGKMQPTNGIWNAKYPDIIFTQRLKDKGNMLHGITAFLRNTVLALHKISNYRRKTTFEFKKEDNG